MKWQDIMSWALGLVIAIIVVVAFAVVRANARRRHSIMIISPKVGFVNFGNSAFASLVDEDRNALSASFGQAVSSIGGGVPTCDVLFVYGRLAPDGSLVGAPPAPTIRHVAAHAGAAIVVLASPNPGERIVAAGKLPGPKSASLVFTIDRKEGFATFFKQLFSLMASGKSMTMAWVAIAPQHSSEMRPGMPETIFVPEAGAVTFQ